MAKVTIYNTRAHLLVVTDVGKYGRVALMPGPNEIDSEILNQMKEQQSFKVWSKEGYLTTELRKEAPKEEVSEQKGDAGDASELAQYTVPDAQELIAETDDIELLKKWRATDNRKGVTQAIDSRLFELEAEE